MSIRGRLGAAWRALLDPKSRPSPRPGLADVTDLSPGDREIVARVRPVTMTSLPRIVSLLDAVEHVVRARVEGAFVECGVWRGGSVLAMALKLRQLGATERDLYLYDTFEGMTEPSAKDTSSFESPALETWTAARHEGRRGWDRLFDPTQFNEDAVRSLLEGSGYPRERLHFVKGPVERTLPAHAPPRIALLRLDTDWYESTRHELEHLYPRLASGGVLIIDDYGHWDGCRRAVDEYFARAPEQRPLLQRIDYTGRLALKQ